MTAIHRLHTARLGQVGRPSPWLVASIPDAELLRSRWGIDLVDIDIDATITMCDAPTSDAAHRVAERFSNGEPVAAGSELERAAMLHPALVSAARAAEVDAVTVRCFDYLDALRTSGCIALAELNDDGFVAGCEGDVASAVAMLLVRVLFDQPSWIANPATIDAAADRMVLAHCTVAPSMVERVELHTHFESGLGIGLRGRFAAGPVTLLRLGGPSLDRLWIANATIECSGDADNLCRTQVTVRVDRGAADDFLEDPLGNHVVLFHGHHRRRVERWWRLAFGHWRGLTGTPTADDDRGLTP